MKNEVKTSVEYEAEISDLKAENAELKRQLNNLKRMTFGQKSEKTKTVNTDAEQISLFIEAEQEQSTSEREEEKSIVVTGHSRKKKRTRDEIFKELPVEEVIHEAGVEVCPERGAEMKEIGKEYLHEELVYVPAKIFRRQHFAQVVRCPDCGE